MIDRTFDIALSNQWSAITYWFLIAVGLVSALIAFGDRKLKINEMSSFLGCIVILLILLLLLGGMPIEWGTGTDRDNYAHNFIRLSKGFSSNYGNDVGFVFITRLLSTYLPVTYVFYAIAAIYLTNYYIAIRRFVAQKSYWLLVAVVLSMGFTSYATNTIRAGLAASFIVLALSFYPSKIKMLICLLIAVSMHKSMALPAAVIALGYFFGNTRLYALLWVISIPVSFLAGDAFSTLFSEMAEDDHLNNYLNVNPESTHYNVGFRIDFIIYSLVPMAVGYYYIFRKNFRSTFYRLLYNSYLLSNIFWILVIRANFSDRFAYLSWFLIPFLLVYPLLKGKMSLKENIWLGTIFVGETVFKLLF